MLELIAGSALAVGALAFVLWPLRRGAAYAADAADGAGAVPAAEPTGAPALDAMREIEFDRATGKLSPEDYAALKARYAPLALAELAARESAAEAAAAASAAAAEALEAAAETSGGEDAAERLIAQMRRRAVGCPEHGPRPEPDAVYCSDCGRHLAGACPHCGTTVESAARFCVGCGRPLAG